MKVELRHLNFLCSDLDRGNVCPACPKVLSCVAFWMGDDIALFCRTPEAVFSQWMPFLGFLESYQQGEVSGSLYMETFISVTKI